MLTLDCARFGLVALVASASIPAARCGTGGAQDNPLAWPAPTQTSRPWTRWWWLGSAVDGPNIDRLLSEYHGAGIGGVEICPIYGAKGYESRFIDYLSPGWMGMLEATERTAGRLDMGVDMTSGTGWPMGGPWVSPVQASESVSLERLLIDPEGRIPESSGILRPGNASGNAGVVPSPPTKTGAQDGLVDLSEGPRVLICLRALGPDGAQVDLTARVQGWRLDWSAPGPGWTAYLLTAQQPVQRVKRAAPGGAGNVVDPYSTRALDGYLARFDSAFGTSAAPMPRAQFQDSFEYFGANWTPGLFDAFARRRGYDLRDRLPELAGYGDADAAERVRADFRLTISELHQEFVAHWTSWSHGHGSKTREQAHGAPANIEDIYAVADIPETEGSFGGGSEEQVPMLKFASSAAHVTGRALASSETFTWLGEHFEVPLSRLKVAADTFFLTGTNHMFLHGIPYSPKDAPWPGWLFYASVNFGPNGGIWHDLPAFNSYVTHCQSILQLGQPDNDVLLYFPVADFWQQPAPASHAGPHQSQGDRPTDPLVRQFTTPGKWMIGSPFHRTAMALWRDGYSYDEVTDTLLLGSRAGRARPGGATQGAGIVLGGNFYRAVVIPPCRYMPVETLRHLLLLARGGATIIFVDGIPSDVPGLADLAARRAARTSLLGGMRLEAGMPAPIAPPGSPATGEPPATHSFRGARLGAGLILAGGVAAPSPAGELSALLNAAGIIRESMADDGLQCIRRARDGGDDYFIANMGSRRVEKWVALARPAASGVLLDPLFPDRAGIAAIRPNRGGAEVFLQANPGQSYILRTFAVPKPSGRAWHYERPSHKPAKALDGPWTVHFVEGGPALPRDFQAAGLGSWTEEDDPEAKRFSGTALYTHAFSLPAAAKATTGWRLDLGQVAESARVRLNGHDVATLWCAPFCVDVGPFLRSGDNRLEVEVTNVAANRIRDLDRRHVDWKRFYEINFVGHDYRPFDASGWPIRDSGLLGPVTLTAMEAAPVASP